jgi:hypothetical protein
MASNVPWSSTPALSHLPIRRKKCQTEANRRAPRANRLRGPADAGAAADADGAEADPRQYRQVPAQPERAEAGHRRTDLPGASQPTAKAEWKRLA